MEVSVVYGVNVIDSLNAFKEKSVKEIERLTTMNIESIKVVAKSIEIPNKED